VVDQPVVSGARKASHDAHAMARCGRESR
jgi:hypothetical protein